LKKKLLLIVASLAALGIAAPSAQATATIVQDIPFDETVVGCTEEIAVSGSLLGVFTETQSASGGFVISFHFQPQGVSGIGLTSGDMYRATGLTRETTVVTPAGGSSFTFVNQFNIVGTSGATTFDVREIAHITVTPTGAITASFDNFSTSC
jgi:hypothetical protein